MKRLAVLLLVGFFLSRAVFAVNSISGKVLTDEERTLAAKLVECECKDAPDIVKISFAAMLLNRLESNNYPSSFSSIVYRFLELEGSKPHENFSGYTDSVKRTERLVAAAEAGLDPTLGALEFSKDDMSAVQFPTLIVGEYIFGFSKY